MKPLISLFFMMPWVMQAQKLPELNPTLGIKVELTAAGEAAFNKEQKACEELFNIDYGKLTAEQKRQRDNCEESPGYWEILGYGCSWYCGGGEDTNTASSELKPNGKYQYTAGNIHDLSYETAWVEGVPGYGIGEKVTYHFPPQNPRITKVKIVNGYVRSDKVWKENSRVKKLKMYLDGKPYAILNLADIKQTQEFSFKPIGRSGRKDSDKLQTLPWWTMTFEIMEVYEGDKYDDTAITEIYFDGIDVH